MKKLFDSIVKSVPKIITGKVVRDAGKKIIKGTTRGIPKLVKGVIRTIPRQIAEKAGGVKVLSSAVRGVLNTPLTNSQIKNVLLASYTAGARQGAKGQALKELGVLAKATKGVRNLSQLQSALNALKTGAQAERPLMKKVLSAVLKGSKSLLGTAVSGADDVARETAKNYITGELVLKGLGGLTALGGTAGGIVLGNKISKDLDKK